MGSTFKVLYMDLMLHEMRGVVRLTRSPGGLAEGFLGIERIVVPPEQRGAFDAGLIPSYAGLRAAPRPKGEIQGKTVAKIWQTAGFIEKVAQQDLADTKVGTLIFEYSQAARDLKRMQARRTHERREDKKREKSGGEEKDGEDEDQARPKRARLMVLPEGKLKDVEIMDEGEEEVRQRLAQRAEALAAHAERAVQDARTAMMRAAHCASVARACA
jgi:hypothetical protein